jgi:hypothetical protein
MAYFGTPQRGEVCTGTDAGIRENLVAMAVVQVVVAVAPVAAVQAVEVRVAQAVAAEEAQAVAAPVVAAAVAVAESVLHQYALAFSQFPSFMRPVYHRSLTAATGSGVFVDGFAPGVKSSWWRADQGAGSVARMRIKTIKSYYRWRF